LARVIIKVFFQQPVLLLLLLKDTSVRLRGNDRCIRVSMRNSQVIQFRTSLGARSAQIRAVFLNRLICGRKHAVGYCERTALDDDSAITDQSSARSSFFEGFLLASERPLMRVRSSVVAATRNATRCDHAAVAAAAATPACAAPDRRLIGVITERRRLLTEPFGIDESSVVVAETDSVEVGTAVGAVNVLRGGNDAGLQFRC
jgi:hypothetical protein